MPPDEVAAVTETPVADALSAETPAEATAPVEGEPGTEAPPVVVDRSKDPAVIEIARKLARDENLPEHAAIRAARKELRRDQAAFEQHKGTIEQQNAQLQAELREAESNPFAWAAKRRGVTEADVYNERTQRAIDPTSAELDAMKKRLEERDEKDRVADEQRKANAATAYQAHVEQNFAAEVIHLATKEPEFKFLQAGLQEGDYRQENVAGEVLKRVRAHYNATEEEHGKGEILDAREVLQRIEKELREEAKRKADRLAKLEAAGQPAIPDREGAVKAATHEATGSNGPRTLTNAHSSQTSGTKRPETRRERMERAEIALRGTGKPSSPSRV